MFFRQLIRFPVVLVLVLAWASALQAADRAQLRAFLEVTGFDVAIESLQQGAMAGPGLAGEDPDAFGTQWGQLAEDVFAPDFMVDRALDMMEVIMPDDLVEHGAAFYASDLGQRLVEVENEAHLAPDDQKYPAAEIIVTALIDEDSPRIGWFRDMSEAIGGIDSSVRAAIEIQLRYLLAAISAGSSDIEMSEEDLRGMLEEQSGEIRQNVELYSILGGAYTYKDISDSDLQMYVEALEHPKMRQIYEILNAIQFEVMAERYERLAEALAGLAPQQDI